MNLVLALAACDAPTVAHKAAPFEASGASEPHAVASDLDGVPPPTDVVSRTPEPNSDVSAQDRQAYAQMEDRYLADAASQWAVSARASSNYGDPGSTPPLALTDTRAWRATGQPDGKTWSDSGHEEGVEWLELGFSRAVPTGEVRVVMTGEAASRAITRLDLIEEGGQYRTVWEGASDVLPDTRGNRTWFVRRFEVTPYRVLGVKLSFANHAARGYKEVDAVQLVAAEASAP